MKEKFLPALGRCALILLGCVGYALSFSVFFQANSIAYGGATGVAQLIHAALGKPDPGLLILLINFPLFLLGWKLLGRRMLLSSLFAVAVSAGCIDLFGTLFRFPATDLMLASVYGGLSMGACLGLIFRQGATTGGTDVAARLLKRKFPGLSLGRLVLMLDLGIILGCALVFGRITSALYGLIALYLSSLAIDSVLYGPGSCRLAYIISPRHREIAGDILSALDRGVTVLSGRGGFSGGSQEVLLCVLRRYEVCRLRRLVRRHDPNAFFVVCDAREVLGSGFTDAPEQGQ